MTLAGYNLQDNVYIYSNNKCMCVFLISPVPITEPLTSELIDTPVFYNLAPRPIKYRVSVPIPTWSPMKSNNKGPQMSRMGQGALGPKGRRAADVQSEPPPHHRKRQPTEYR